LPYKNQDLLYINMAENLNCVTICKAGLPYRVSKKEKREAVMECTETSITVLSKLGFVMYNVDKNQNSHKTFGGSGYNGKYIYGLT
jgi:hypothetical protein